MQKLTEKQKKRIKHALRVMRLTSQEKYEVIKDIHKIDPSQIETGETAPTLSALMSYCHLFDRCPGWLLLLSCQVDQDKLSEKDFETMILEWNQIEPLADLITNKFIGMARINLGLKNGIS